MRTSEERREDFKWFMGEMPDLYQEHGHCWAVICDKKVLATFDSKDMAYEAAKKLLGAGNYIIQEVGPDPSVYTVSVASVIVNSSEML